MTLVGRLHLNLHFHAIIADGVLAPDDDGTPSAPRAAAVASGEVAITDFGITVRHLDRLLGGLLLATAPRIEWAKLMRRPFAIDALRCPKCAGKMRLLATIIDSIVVKKILSHLALRTDPLPPARARDPTGQESFDFDAA